MNEKIINENDEEKFSWCTEFFCPSFIYTLKEVNARK